MVNTERPVNSLTLSPEPIASPIKMKVDTKHKFVERVCVLLRWNACDAFNVLDKWEATYAVSADAIANKPENWVPLWGWKKRLPSAAEGG